MEGKRGGVKEIAGRGGRRRIANDAAIPLSLPPKAKKGEGRMLMMPRVNIGVFFSLSPSNKRCFLRRRSYTEEIETEALLVNCRDSS